MTVENQRPTGREIEVLNRALKLENVNICHWGGGACMLKVTLSDDIYIVVRLDDFKFEDDYPHEGEA